MTQEQLDNFRKLVHHNKTSRGHENWSFRTFNEYYTEYNACGTVGCAGGELPVIWPDKFMFHGNQLWVVDSDHNELSSYDPGTFIAEFFGITREECGALFFPIENATDEDDCMSDQLPPFSNLERWIARAEFFLSIKETELDKLVTYQMFKDENIKYYWANEDYRHQMDEWLR